MRICALHECLVQVQRRTLYTLELSLRVTENHCVAYWNPNLGPLQHKFLTAELSIKHYNADILLERNLYSRITSHFLGK